MKRSLSLWQVRNVSLVLAILVALAPAWVGAAVPATLNYQGYLTDSLGQPVSGSKSIVFSLYDVASGGTAFWSETQTVQVTNGRFSVVLGKTTPLNPDQFTGTTFIGFKVGSDAEMAPRQQFTSVAYAIKAGNAVSMPDPIPKGLIAMWSGSVANIPTGWALCDGTNGTPNLKDKFIVGAGGTYPVGGTGGSSTINLQHSHTINDHTHAGVNHLHGIAHEHYVSRVNDGTHNGDGRGMSTGGDYSGYTGWWPISNPNSGLADRDLTTGSASDKGTNNQLSTSQPILPPYYALAYIMKL